MHITCLIFIVVSCGVKTFVLANDNEGDAKFWHTLLKQLQQHESRTMQANTIRSHCGRSRYDKDFTFHKRIVGGEESKESEWPWLVSLNVYGLKRPENVTKFGHVCGGTLISPQWILTAGHCITAPESTDDPKKWLAVIGEHNLKEDEQHQQSYTVEKIIVNPIFNTTSIMNDDTALIKLTKPAKMGRYVAPACLPYPTESYDAGLICTAAGWGKTKEESENFSDVPRHVDVPLLPFDYCQQKYNDTQSYMIELDRRSMMCAGEEEGGKDSCQYDSGGPLMCKAKDGQYIVAGVVSFGIGCAQAGFPGIYARISNEIAWIKSVVESE